MNIRSISNTSKQDNCSNKNNSFAFGSYSSSITKKDLNTAIRFIDSDNGYGLTEKTLKYLTRSIWGVLKSIDKTCKNDKVVDVKPFIEGERIWVGVGTSKEVKEQQALAGFGQGNYGIFSESLMSTGQNLKKSVNEHVAVLRMLYQHLVK